MPRKQRQPISFVFNSRVLVPWSVVEPFQEEGRYEELKEAILLWQETYQENNKFKENDFVVDTAYPYQKMVVKSLKRQPYDCGDGPNKEKKWRLMGIECYFWIEVSIEELLKQLSIISERRAVPGVKVIPASELSENT